MDEVAQDGESTAEKVEGERPADSACCLLDVGVDEFAHGRADDAAVPGEDEERAGSVDEAEEEAEDKDFDVVEEDAAEEVELGDIAGDLLVEGDDGGFLDAKDLCADVVGEDDVPESEGDGESEEEDDEECKDFGVGVQGVGFFFAGEKVVLNVFHGVVEEGECGEDDEGDHDDAGVFGEDPVAEDEAEACVHDAEEEEEDEVAFCLEGVDEGLEHHGGSGLWCAYILFFGQHSLS